MVDYKYVVEYKNGTSELVIDKPTISPDIKHVTPWVHDDYGDYDGEHHVDAMYTIAINVVGVVARHLSSLGRRDMYAIDDMIRLTYVRIYAGMTPSDAVQRIDNADCQDMVDTAVCAITEHMWGFELDEDGETPLAYYDTIVRPSYKAVNALVWAERRQAHVSMDQIVLSYDIESQTYVDVGVSRWLLSARQGDIKSALAQKVKTLTPIQYSVLWDLCHGMSYRAIAVKRQRSFATIQSHVQALRRIFDHMPTSNS